MVARAEEFTRGGSLARSAARTRATARYSRLQRTFFVIALLGFATASSYAGLGLLTRAYPAVFPGENAPFSQVLGGLPGPAKVEQPDETSVFNKRINILILGSDARWGENPIEQRTDVIMVASIDPVTKTPSMLSFPRDLYITHHLPDGSQYEGRINESFQIGGDHGGNFDSAAEQVERDLYANFGIEIDYYLVMDFLGVESLIEELGGIELTIPEELAVPDWWYSDESGRVDAHWISFPAGTHQLDGYNAVAFGRYREDSDLKRMKRQQLVLETAMVKAFREGLFDPLKARSLYDEFNNSFQHNVSLQRALGLANLALESRGEIHTFSIGDPVDGRDTVWDWTTPGGASVLLWDQENVRYWLNQTFTKATYAASNVEIQNGYGFGGESEVEALGRYLRFAKGFPTVYKGPDAELQPTSSIIVYDEARLEMAQDIAGWMSLPDTAVLPQYSEDQTLPDVLIIIGQDFVVPGG